MAISYDSLPDSKPTGYFKEPGIYKAKIITAEMRKGQTSGKNYLSITYELTDKNNKPAGKFFDNFFDVDKEIPKWKIKRFITAIGLTGLTTFELSQLTKICVNKTILVDIGVDSKDKDKNVVDVFTGDVYYPEAEWLANTGSAEDILSGGTTPTINALDAVDAGDVPDTDSADY